MLVGRLIQCQSVISWLRYNRPCKRTHKATISSKPTHSALRPSTHHPKCAAAINAETDPSNVNIPVHSHYTTTTPSPSPPSAPAVELPSSPAAQSPAAAHDAHAGADSNNLTGRDYSHVQAADLEESTPRCSSSLQASQASACYGEQD